MAHESPLAPAPKPPVLPATSSGLSTAEPFSLDSVDRDRSGNVGGDSRFRWMDLLWLGLVGFLAVLHPIFEIHKQLTLLAIGLFQIFDRRLLASVKPARRNVYIVLVKIVLATLLVGHTGTLPIASPYWLIYYVPVVSAAMLFEAPGTLFWTAVASAAYCSYLLPALKEFELTAAGETELAIRVLFLFLPAVIINRFVSESRRQSESYRALAETLAETNFRLKQAQAEVRRSERLAALGQLTAGVAHEIRNPLGVIKGSAELLGERLSSSDPLAQELAGYISSQVDRLNGIVSRFLDFARPVRLEGQLIEIPSLIDRALKAVSAVRPGARVMVHTEYAPKLAPVWGDEQLFEQVFTNLAINAYQAMGESGGKLRVAVRPANIGAVPGIEIEFEDSGPGVASELQEEIFNPFFTTKKDGVGLGLSIVSKIIDEHGGSIRLVSEPGHGACFRVFLPREEV